MIWANGFQFWASRLLISRLTFQHLSLLPLSLNLRLDLFYLLSQPSGPEKLQQFKKNVCSYCIILFSIVFAHLTYCLFFRSTRFKHTFHRGFTPGGFRLALQLSLKVVGKAIDQAVQIAGLFSHLSVLFLGVLPNFPAGAAWAFPSFPLQEMSKKWSSFMSFDAFRLKVSKSFFIFESCKSTKNLDRMPPIGFLPVKIRRHPPAEFASRVRSISARSSSMLSSKLSTVALTFSSTRVSTWSKESKGFLARTGTGPHSNSRIIDGRKPWRKPWRKSSENLDFS